MSTDGISSGPVVEGVAAPISLDPPAAVPLQHDEHLPLATAVTVCPPPSSSIKDIVHKEMSAAFQKEKQKQVDVFSSFQVAMMRDVNQYTTTSLKNYEQNELPAVITSRVDVLFPLFLADNSLVRRHLDGHLALVDELMSTRKKEVAGQLDALATAAAEKMARTDTFGSIYQSVVKTANSRVAEESRRVQAEVFARLESEVRVTRQQRDSAMRQFSALNCQLEEHVTQQKRYKLMAFSGFCMGVVSLSSIVLASLFDKRR